MNFEIDSSFLTSVTIVTEYSIFKDKSDLTEDDMIKILGGNDIVRTTSTDDHPEFKKLREYLCDNGFISIWSGVWNGDKVLKKFTLNNAIFDVDDRFPCGAAMIGHMKFNEKWLTL